MQELLNALNKYVTEIAKDTARDVCTQDLEQRIEDAIGDHMDTRTFDNLIEDRIENAVGDFDMSDVYKKVEKKIEETIDTFDMNIDTVQDAIRRRIEDAIGSIELTIQIIS